ncbi:MAG: GFA family protein [Gammaproteobacteria bacterium]|nr:GFA family protein [Gammaproteobacteria bacterium]MCP4879383.1 GFA family protein [Gammaproteobacteria bacterium]MDP6165763.1 GFA family protein [Gammaproteobacteria bacterium]
MKRQNGSCLCGGVRFELHGPLRPLLACHCVQCRKTSGHYWVATNVSYDKLVLTNDDGLKWYASSNSAQRGFCQQCGASLFWQWHNSGSISVAAGALDGPTGCHIEAHIFTAHKGDYYQLPVTENVRPLELDVDVK